MNLEKIQEHYDHAREKHPYFCDKLAPQYDKERKTARIKRELEVNRELIADDSKNNDLQWDVLLNCEVWEIHEAINNGDTAQAVEECYDAIAVLLRVVDVLEGRQKLGKPEKEGEQK